MGFEFQALQDQLVQMKREILELKRFAPSGVPITGELGVSTVGAPLVFDGPTGGLRATVLRINQWGEIQFSGFAVSAAGASGAAYLQLPWPIIGAHPSGYTPIGSFDCGGGTTYVGTIYVYGNSPAVDITMWTHPSTNGGGGVAQVGATSPFTWPGGAGMRGSLRARIAPGF